jgi:hypothetical protein
LDAVTTPDFPTRVLPPRIRAFVEELAMATQTPADLPALLTLATVSAAVAKRFEVELRAGWREPLNVYALVALPPASRKSAVFSEVKAPLEAHERREAELAEPRIRELEGRKRVAEKRLDKCIDEGARSTGEKDCLEAEGRRLEATEQLGSIVVPPRPRFIVSDITAEKIASMLAEQGGRLAVMDAEGGLFGVLSGRYSSGAPNFEVLLKGHSGDDLRVDRQGRPPDFVASPALTLALAVQPDVVRSLAGTPGFRGQGLLGRFLYAIPESNIGRRKLDVPPVSDAARLSYHDCVAQLLSIPSPACADGGAPRAAALRLSDEARARFRSFEETVEGRLGDRGDLAPYRDWGGKLCGAVARIAGLLHCATFPAAPADESISLSTMKAAVAIGDYLIPHAQAAFAMVGEDPAIEDARHVLRWIQRIQQRRFSRRDALRGVRGSLKTSETVRRALETLSEHGYVRPLPGGPPVAGRPSEMWEVNPYVLSGQNGQNP